MIPTSLHHLFCSLPIEGDDHHASRRLCSFPPPSAICALGSFISSVPGVGVRETMVPCDHIRYTEAAAVSHTRQITCMPNLPKRGGSRVDGG
jgi:hypothetical protein